MTPYRFANQEKKQKVSRTKIVVVAVFLVLVVLLAVFVLAPLLQTASRGPAWLARSVQNGIGDAVTMATPKSTLITRNKLLTDKVESYEAQLIELQQLRDENDQLRKELSYLPVPDETITAQILGKPSQSLMNSMVINAGTAQGVRVGQLVTVQHHLGLGTVASVSPKTAVVELFGGPQFSGDVLLVNKNITVPSTGKGLGNFEIHIPREVAVSDGDFLAFPGNPSVVIGVVKSIIFDPRDPFQTVLARAPVNIQELRFVQVVK
jgi:cell shape-determining protein MreC